jgi:hypothetical protein|uniref:Chromate resistance protein ChrB n=1 Tax=Pigmentiphaga litoralis TaxID=516702 RepID=UPI00389A92F9
MSEESAEEASGAAGWLVLVYRVPAEPTRHRSTVWRRLKSMGAVYLQNSVAAMPAGRASEHALRKLRREILDMEGTAWILRADALVGNAEIRGLFQQARDGEYEEILDKCADFHAGLEKEYAAAHFTYGELEENEVELVKLRSWMEKVRARDAFGAPLREKTEAAIAACAEALEAYAGRVYEEDGDGA